MHALEQLIIDAIYSELLRGKLDQNQQQFEVEHTVGRDVPNDALTSLLASLEDWCVISLAVYHSSFIRMQVCNNIVASIHAGREVELSFQPVRCCCARG